MEGEKHVPGINVALHDGARVRGAGNFFDNNVIALESCVSLVCW